MARIKDIIAAIICDSIHFEETVRTIVAIGYRSDTMDESRFDDALNWHLTADDYQALARVAARKIPYVRINLLMSFNGSRECGTPAITSRHVTELLSQLYCRDELHYPYAVIAAQQTLFISHVDFETLTAIARELRVQEERQNSLPARQALSSIIAPND